MTSRRLAAFTWGTCLLLALGTLLVLALDALSSELHSVVAGTMQPPHVSRWLREAGR